MEFTNLMICLRFFFKDDLICKQLKLCHLLFKSIKSILKSLVILVMSLALSGAIYSRIASPFALNRIFFLANKNGTVKENNHSDFKASFQTNQSHCRRMKQKKAIV